MTRLRVLLARVRGLGSDAPASDEDLRDQIQRAPRRSRRRVSAAGPAARGSPPRARAAISAASRKSEEACRDARGRWLRDLSQGRALRRCGRSGAIPRSRQSRSCRSRSASARTPPSSASSTRCCCARARSPIPDRLVELYAGDAAATRTRPRSYPSYLEFRDRNEVFTGLAAYSIWQFKLTDANQSSRSGAKWCPATTSTCSACSRRLAASSSPTKSASRAAIPSS